MTNHQGGKQKTTLKKLTVRNLIFLQKKKKEFNLRELCFDYLKNGSWMGGKVNDNAGDCVDLFKAIYFVNENYWSSFFFSRWLNCTKANNILDENEI